MSTLGTIALIIALFLIVCTLVIALPEPPHSLQRARVWWRPSGGGGGKLTPSAEVPPTTNHHHGWNCEDEDKLHMTMIPSCPTPQPQHRPTHPKHPERPPPGRPPRPPPGSHRLFALASYTWRSYDGAANNLVVPTRGMRTMPLVRKCSPAYADGAEALATRGELNPSPRALSNAFCAETAASEEGGGDPVLSAAKLSDLIWAFGQFVDHEIDLTPNSNDPADVQPMRTATTAGEDPRERYLDRSITFTRSMRPQNTGISVEASTSSGGGGAFRVREQPNQISAYIDGTNVYGDTPLRATALRRLDGSGKLRTGEDRSGREQLMPRNTSGLDNANAGPTPAERLFLAGDVRANENALLTAMHTVFVREHNFQCDVAVTRTHPEWLGQDEMIYQHARRIVVGIMQRITYAEFLPALLGEGSLPAYSGYKEDVDAGIATEFSTVGYRFGHSAVSSSLNIVGGGGAGNESSSSSSVDLRDVFFAPDFVYENGVDGLLLGASRATMREIDGTLVDALRNALFGPPSRSNVLDLAALNMQRARDHGIPGYNAVRAAYGLAPRARMQDLSSDTATAARLRAMYGTDDPSVVDPWLACMLEPHSAERGASQVGETTRAILVDQFTRLRDGDRFYYANDPALSDAEKRAINTTRLSDVLRRNTRWATSSSLPSASAFASDVFHTR